MLLKCCMQYASKFGKLSSGHKTGKGQFSLQSQRKAMPKNVQTTTPLCLFHMLAKLCSKFSKLGFSILPDHQAGFRKGKGTKKQNATFCWIIEKAREFQKNIYFCFIDYTTAFDCVDHNKLWKILQEMGMSDLITCHLGNLYAGQEATVQNWEGST